MATIRTWNIGLELDELGNTIVDEDKLNSLLNDLLGTLRSIGGTFQVAALRREAKPGSQEGVTVGYAVMWQAYVPMEKAPEPDPMPHEVESEPVKEPVEA